VEDRVLAEISSAEIQESFALDVLEMVAKSLERIHKIGYVHGDIKPENIIITVERKAFLIDLNTALPRDVLQVSTDQFPGTINYMSIEALAGGASEVGIPRDIHALGALLYELLEGSPLVSGKLKEDVFVVQAANRHSTEDKFSERTSRASRSIVRLATSPDPDLRFDGCASFINAVQQARFNPDSEIRMQRDPICTAFRLGVGIGEVLFVLQETTSLVDAIEASENRKLSNQQMLGLLGVPAISEDSRIVKRLASELDIDLPTYSCVPFFFGSTRLIGRLTTSKPLARSSSSFSRSRSNRVATS
jgi:serine/threonine protein kinase